jgi:DNA-binding NtrC family response regulator
MKKRILLVDDEIITLKLTKKYLKNSGFEIEIASDSTAAIQALTSENFDMIVIDITMPTLSGFDLVQLMQSLDIITPVIFLSNNDNQWSIEESYSLGAKRFVSKEREFNRLPEIIHDVLSQES